MSGCSIRPLLLSSVGGFPASVRTENGFRLMKRRESALFPAGVEFSGNPFLAAHGFATISASVRLSQQAPFPAQLHDAKAIIRWLRANAQSYSIDPEHIGVWGSSASGHLASLLGLTADYPLLEGNSGSPGYSSQVQAVMTICAPSDFLLPGGEMINDAPLPHPSLNCLEGPSKSAES